MVNQENYRPLIEWINQEGNDFFWLEKLREAFGCLTSDYNEYPQNLLIRHFIAMLRSKGVIQCTEVRKSKRQYHRVRIVTMEDLHRH